MLERDRSVIAPERSDGFPPRHPHLVIFLAALVSLVPAASRAATANPARDGGSYAVSAIELRYQKDHPEQPDPAHLLGEPIELGQVSDGFVEPREGIPSESVSLAALPAGSRIYRSGIVAIGRAIVAELGRRGISAVVVRPDLADIDAQGIDQRGERTTLAMVIYTGRVSEIRTIASGERIPDNQRIDHPAHARIREHSPIHSVKDGADELIREKEIQDYVARLNRHPGRRVSANLQRSRDPGQAYLDFLVSEYKPWSAYAQYSNTGTQSTTRDRERFGFVHNQLTNRDDILRLDYVTGNFNEVNSVFGSYELPIWSERTRDRLKLRFESSWSKYDASQLGLVGETFKGKQWGGGAELVYTLLQDESFFLDASGGARYQHLTVDNSLTDQNGTESFAIALAGLRAERIVDLSQFVFDLSAETNLSDSKPANMAVLGRTDPDGNWDVLRWSLAGSAYLEPFFHPAGYAEPGTPAYARLANEAAILIRGQDSLGARLIPQEEMTAGGLYTVRGYPQSRAVGDRLYMASVEYRLHLPRLLGFEAEPSLLPVLGQVKWFPRGVQRPDWDFVLRAFMDYANVSYHAPTSFEQRDTLLGAGVGMTLTLKRNLLFALDWGRAFKATGIEGSQLFVDHDNTETHFLITLLY